MNKHIFLSVIVFVCIFLSIILGMQIEWGNISIVLSLIVLIIGAVSFGSILKDIIKEYKRILIEKEIHNKAFFEQISIIKADFKESINNVDKHICLNLKENTESINRSLNIIDIKIEQVNLALNNLNENLLEIENKINNFDFNKIIKELHYINDIMKILDDINEVTREMFEASNDKLDKMVSRLKNIDRKLETIEEVIEDSDFSEIIEATKNYIKDLDDVLQRENRENRLFIEESLEKYKDICNTFIEHSRDMTKEDMDILSKLLGEYK